MQVLVALKRRNERGSERTMTWSWKVENSTGHRVMDKMVYKERFRWAQERKEIKPNGSHLFVLIVSANGVSLTQFPVTSRNLCGNHYLSSSRCATIEFSTQTQLTVPPIALQQRSVVT